VADEVRKLAESSGKESKRIDGELKAIRESVNLVVSLAAGRAPPSTTSGRGGVAEGHARNAADAVGKQVEAA
jgi:methyl-accepting chemotaxis protein